MFMAILLAALAFGAIPSLAPARELVRVRISQFTGAEPLVVDSVTHPELFVLDPSIASVTLAANNEGDPSKGDDGPGRYLPVLSPAFLGAASGVVDVVIRPQT